MSAAVHEERSPLLTPGTPPTAAAAVASAVATVMRTAIAAPAVGKRAMPASAT